MNTDPRPILLALIAITFGLGCEQEPSNPGASAELHDSPPAEVVATSTPDAPTNPMETSPVTSAALEVPDEADSDSPPEIDFPMLDRARRLDFINPELIFPESLKELDGRQVSLVGFMAPYDDLRNMRRCMIVPSYVGCKFCSPPNISQVVFVTQGDDDDSGAYRFIESPCHVTGILRLSLPDSEHDGKRQGFMYSIEDAVVTVHPGEIPEQAAGHESTPHQMRVPRLAPIAMNDLVQEVADLIDKEPLRPIEFEAVSKEEFDTIIRTELQADFPEETRAARSRAFHLLGLIPENADWIDTLTEFKLSRRVAATDDAGERIRLLDSVPDNHPYVRLERVGEIANALALQHLSPERPGSKEDDTNGQPESNDDARRAREAIRQGFRTMTIYRYARDNGIPAGARPPAEFIEQSIERRDGKEALERAAKSSEFGLWEAIPGITGSFYIDTQVGETGSLSDVDPALIRPPATTMELFRPEWYTDATKWRRDPVPSDFADDLMDSPPVLTDVLGIGGLAPLLTQWYSFDVAKRLASEWAGDRWAIWELPDDESALILETRWQDEAAALRFIETIPDDPSWMVLPHLPGSNRAQVLRADSARGLDLLSTAVLESMLRDQPAAATPDESAPGS